MRLQMGLCCKNLHMPCREQNSCVEVICTENQELAVSNLLLGVGSSNDKVLTLNFTRPPLNM